LARMEGSSSTMAMARAIRFSLVHLAPRKEVPSGEPASYGPGAQALPGAVRNLPQIARGPPLTCPAAGADARPNGCCRYSCRGCRLWNTPALAPQTRRPLTPEGVQRGGPHAVRGPLPTASRFVPLLVGRGLGAQASRPLVFICAFVHEHCSVQALREHEDFCALRVHLAHPWADFSQQPLRPRRSADSSAHVRDYLLVIAAAEDRGTRDECIRACACDVADIAGLHAAIDFEMDRA